MNGYGNWIPMGATQREPEVRSWSVLFELNAQLQLRTHTCMRGREGRGGMYLYCYGGRFFTRTSEFILLKGIVSKDRKRTF